MAVLRTLVEQWNTVPIVLLTANASALASQLPDGALAVVAKPFDLDELLAVLAQHCPRAQR